MNLKKFRKGDEETFMDLVAEYAPAVRAYLAGRLYGYQDLEDLVQETFIAAYHAKHSLNDVKNLEAWLKGIARNKLKLYYRTKFRRQEMTLNFQEFISASIEENFDDHQGIEERKILQKCIRKLPAKLRRLVTLRHLSGIRVKDLAEDEGCSESQVSVNLFRAREKLKECVQRNL